MFFLYEKNFFCNKCEYYRRRKICWFVFESVNDFFFWLGLCVGKLVIEIILVIVFCVFLFYVICLYVIK